MNKKTSSVTIGSEEWYLTVGDNLFLAVRKRPSAVRRLLVKIFFGFEFVTDDERGERAKRFGEEHTGQSEDEKHREKLKKNLEEWDKETQKNWSEELKNRRKAETKND